MQTLPQLWFSFQGRASRRDYWVRFVFLSIVVTIIAYLVDGIANAGGLILVIWQLIFLWPTFALGVKRYHDRGKSGRSFVFLECALLALCTVAAIASFPVARAQAAGAQPPSLYVGIMFTATFAIIVLAVYLLVAIGVRKGEAGPNRYGPDPLEKPTQA
jgi:uncharacterized membrane protein YhaH (DUF805 family)